MTRGDAWPTGRTVLWLLGLLSLVSVTWTGLAGYAAALFSVYMAQHMVLSMLTPILLLLAAPIMLTLRAFPLLGHQLMLIHFLAVGLLFSGPILAIDLWPRRSAAGLRLVELLIAVPFHALFGVIVMQTAYPLSRPSRTRAAHSGSTVTMAVFVQWIRSDRRGAARYDSQAVRGGDAALARYNDALRQMHERTSGYSPLKQGFTSP